MSIFGKEIDDAAEKANKAKIKASEFEQGLTLQFLSVERIKSQYGAEADSTIVEKGILEEGEQFLFHFNDKEGIKRHHYSTSMPFFIGMKQVKINEGDWINIKREGVKDKTRYTVTVVDAPAGAKSPSKEAEVDPDNIPF